MRLSDAWEEVRLDDNMTDVCRKWRVRGQSGLVVARPIGARTRRLLRRQKILYDGQAGRITNVPEANALLGRKYRDGWPING